jgi:hypothetical protein
MGSGRSWGLYSPLVGGAILFYIACVLYGAILGAVIGLFDGLIQRLLPRTRRASWRTWLRWLIRFSAKKRSSGASADGGLSRFMRRNWMWLIGAPLHLALAVGFGSGIYLGWMVDRRLAAATRAADRDDPNWRLDDLMANRDPVPDEENSALLVAAVVSLLPEYWPSGPAAEPGKPTPPPSSTKKAFDRLADLPDNVRLADAAAKTLRSELKEYGEAIRIARMAVDYRRGRHELELGPTLIDTRLPETQAARTPARLLAADAAIRVHDGDADGALDTCRAILGVGRSIGDEPFLVSQLVRIAIGSVAMNSTRRVLGQGEPSEPALARLQALIFDELDQPILLFGTKGERATFYELIRRVGSGELPISALSSDPKATFGEQQPVIAGGPKLWFDYQRAVELEWLNEAVAIARRPPAERPPLWDALQAEVDRVRRSRIGIYTTTLPLLLTPALFSSGVADARYHADLGATALLLAAERHRRRSGTWPTTIEAIAPDILAITPVDPFSGKPFRMERRDGQLFMYSVGPNRKDEHGDLALKRVNMGGPDAFGGSLWDVSMRRQPPAPGAH